MPCCDKSRVSHANLSLPLATPLSSSVACWGVQIDKEGANPENAKSQLSEQGLMPEEWGGSTPMVEVRPLKGLLQSEGHARWPQDLGCMERFVACVLSADAQRNSSNMSAVLGRRTAARRLCTRMKSLLAKLQALPLASAGA